MSVANGDRDGPAGQTRDLGAVGALVAALLAGAAADGAAADRPNVLFIAVDDMRVELGCYGSPVVQSPNLDALAERSLLFERAYCQQALCNPSRASLLTGMRIDSLGFTDLPTHFRQRRPDVVTLPQLFKHHGYAAHGIGKIFHNFRQDDWEGDAVSWSRPQVLHYGSHGNDRAQVDGPVPADSLAIPRAERREVPDDAYWDGQIADLAVERLNELKDEPFFLAVGFWKPHLPFNAPAKYWDRYDPAAIDLPANPAPPAGVPPLALHDSRELLRDFPDGLTDDEVRTLRHGYYAAISYVDAQIGKVLDELDRLGLREETIVVFWSDHGFHTGEHALWCKTSNFELDARVPLMISVPGSESAGQRTGALVELLDLYPTLADLAGLEPPSTVEGVSLRPLLGDPGATVHDVAFTQNPRPTYRSGTTPPEAMGYSVRSEDFRYTEWRDFDSGETLAAELYDHRRDPLETTNRVDDPALAATVARLRGRLGEFADLEPHRTAYSTAD
ncbi:sulfatase [Alienimonas sp. DA493]|uniref:sulfatase n=1 Tax=Alienimonas sp. DA493 TaxID=3373605 RepID=UPI003754E1F4